MAEGDVLASEGIQRYIDGRLGERDRAVVAAYLRTHPAAAAEVEALRRQSEVLRQIGQDILSEPVPERLREVLRRRWYH
jgi:anti-sigma factor RsiW